MTHHIRIYKSILFSEGTGIMYPDIFVAACSLVACRDMALLAQLPLHDQDLDVPKMQHHSVAVVAEQTHKQIDQGT